MADLCPWYFNPHRLAAFVLFILLAEVNVDAVQGAITTFTKGAATDLIKKGIRMNCIAPGPVWTPLVASSFPEDMVSMGLTPLLQILV